MRNRLIRGALLVAALALAACSTGTRLAYNHLGTLARWEAGQYVDLTPEQKTAFDREFAPLWDWHRGTQLPLYASTLRSIAAGLESGPPDRAAIDRLAADVDRYATSVADRARPGLARLLATLTDEQVDALLKARRVEFDKTLRKQRTKSPEQRRRQAQDEREEGLKTWLGSVTPPQQALLAADIEADIARGAFDPDRLRAERDRQLDQLAQLLAQRRQPDFEQRLKAMEDPADPAQRQAAAAAQERGRAQFAALAATLDDAQRQHLRKRLLAYAEDFEALAAQTRAPR